MVHTAGRESKLLQKEKNVSEEKSKLHDIPHGAPPMTQKGEKMKKIKEILKVTVGITLFLLSQVEWF